MVAKILGKTHSATAPFLYNEQKVILGVADLVMASGVNGYYINQIMETFEKYENNPAIDDRTRYLGFHMAVNPGPTDNMDEPAVMAFICEHMKNLGFGDQPYVVYRHNDIERQHYHVVSVRIDEKGKVINDSFLHFRALESMKQLAPKYGFHIGADPAGKELSGIALEPAFLDMTKDHVMDQIVANLNEVLDYEFNDFTEFAAAMRSWGLEVSVVEKRNQQDKEKKQRLLRFKALGRDGKPRSRYLFIDNRNDGGISFAERLEIALIDKSRKPRTPEKVEWLRTAVEYCYGKSASFEDFLVKLNSCGITPYSLSKTETGVRKDRKLRNLILVDQENRIALSLPRIGGSVGMAQLESMKKKGGAERLSESEVRQVRDLFEARIGQPIAPAPEQKPAEAPTHGIHR